MAFAWLELLEDIFSDGVSGIACVLENENESFSYLIWGGSVIWKYVKVAYWKCFSLEMKVLTKDVHFQGHCPCTQ